MSDFPRFVDEVGGAPRGFHGAVVHRCSNFERYGDSPQMRYVPRQSPIEFRFWELRSPHSNFILFLHILMMLGFGL